MKKQSCVTWIQTVSGYIQKHDIYKDIAEDFEIRFDTSNQKSEFNSLDRPSPKGKNQKVI